MYSSYTAAVMPRQHDLAAKHGVNLEGAVTWAFEFEDQPYFDGFRDLATNGIDMPVLNVFRMFGMMSGERVAVESPAAAALDTMLAAGVKEKPDVHAMASIDAHRRPCWFRIITIRQKPDRRSRSISRSPGSRTAAYWCEHFRVDDEHSNSYEVWKKMGSPQQPSPEQYAQLEAAGQLQTLTSPRWVHAEEGRLRVPSRCPCMACR